MNFKNILPTILIVSVALISGCSSDSDVVHLISNEYQISETDLKKLKPHDLSEERFYAITELLLEDKPNKITQVSFSEEGHENFYSDLIESPWYRGQHYVEIHFYHAEGVDYAITSSNIEYKELINFIDFVKSYDLNFKNNESYSSNLNIAVDNLISKINRKINEEISSKNYLNDVSIKNSYSLFLLADRSPYFSIDLSILSTKIKALEKHEALTNDLGLMIAEDRYRANQIKFFENDSGECVAKIPNQIRINTSTIGEINIETLNSLVVPCATENKNIASI